MEVHGILYLFEKLLEHDIIDSETAIERMEALKNINTVCQKMKSISEFIVGRRKRNRRNAMA